MGDQWELRVKLAIHTKARMASRSPGGNALIWSVVRLRTCINIAYKRVGQQLSHRIRTSRTCCSRSRPADSGTAGGGGGKFGGGG